MISFKLVYSLKYKIYDIKILVIKWFIKFILVFILIYINSKREKFTNREKLIK